MQNLMICDYTPDREREWDKLISESNNGTFLFFRKYMEYHKNRFVDASTLLYRDKELFAVFPAIRRGVVFNESDIISHGGLTYGGLIFKYPIYLSDVLDSLAALEKHYKATKMVYKPVPWIYHRHPTQIEEYALREMGYKLETRNISTFHSIPLQQYQSKDSKYDINKGFKNKLVYGCDSENLPEFWNISKENLGTKHNTKPVHSLEEIKYLMALFPKNILFRYATSENGILLGGMIIYSTPLVDHVQYMASNSMGHQFSALKWIISIYVHSEMKDKLLDFGISNERSGELNMGLHRWKEKFGCGSICYDTYSKEIS